MATPMTADQRLAAYRRWGLKIKEHPGWRNHNRNKAGPWGPVHGIVIHHTGDDAPDSADENVLWNGRSDLPGPLCHDGQADDGTVVMISAGRANHAGAGSGRVLNAMKAGQVPPAPGPDDTDGNAHFYGRETMYSGGHPPTAAAYRATVLACAAICEFHGWNPHSSIIGHNGWTKRKIDPRYLSIPGLRDDVATELRLGPPALRKPTTTKPTTTTTRREAPMYVIYTEKGQYTYDGGSAPCPIPNPDIMGRFHSTDTKIVSQPPATIHLTEAQKNTLTAYHVANDRALVAAVVAALTPVIKAEGINPAELATALANLEIPSPGNASA